MFGIAVTVIVGTKIRRAKFLPFGQDFHSCIGGLRYFPIWTIISYRVKNRLSGIVFLLPATISPLGFQRSIDAKKWNGFLPPSRWIETPMLNVPPQIQFLQFQREGGNNLFYIAVGLKLRWRFHTAFTTDSSFPNWNNPGEAISLSGFLFNHIW